MNDNFSLHSVLVIFLSVLAGLAYAWLLYGRSGNLARRQRLLLAAFRALAVAVLCALLFFPPFRRLRFDEEKPVVVLVQDNSRSVSQTVPKGFSQKQYENDLKQLVTRLRSDYHVEVVHFNEKSAGGLNFSPQGNFTNAADMASALNNRLLNRNVGAVIFATDGIFNRGGNPQYELTRLRAPVYTIALGDPELRRDLTIADVRYNDVVYLDNVFNIEVAVDAYKSVGIRSDLAIYENNKKLDSKTLQFDKAESHQTVNLKVQASKPGIHRYTVRLAAAAGEASLVNNSQSFFIEVIDDRQKILLAAAAPHPDLGAIRQALAHNRHYDVSVAVGAGLDTLKLPDYSLVLLYQLPFAQGAGKQLLAKLADSPVPRWYLVGAQSDLSAFSQVQQAVRLTGSGAILQDVQAGVAPGATAFSLESGTEKLKNFDPLRLPAGRAEVSAQVNTVLIRKTARAEAGEPILFFSTTDRHKAGYLLGEGLWRWRLAEAKEDEATPFFNDLILKSAQYLTTKDDKRKLRVYTSKPTYDENEHVLFTATLYNDSYEPVTDASLRLQVKDEKGRTYNFAFGASDDRFQLDAGTFSQGIYSYTAAAAYKGKTYNLSGRFLVSSTNLENRQTTADHQLLNSIAKQTGGQLYKPAQLLEVAEAIQRNPNVRPVRYEDLRYEEAIGLKTLFFLVLALLTAEWLLRKRNGAV